MSRHSLYSSHSSNSGSSYRTSASYCQPEPGRHNGGVYRETDPYDSRAVRIAAHFLQGPFSGTLRKSDRQHSSSRHGHHHHHHHGGSGSSSYSFAPSTSSRNSASSPRSRSPDSMRWQQQQHQQQQQHYQHPQQQYQQQQQPRYPGPQAGYRPAGPGYGPAGQQQQQQQQPSFARQPPDVWGKGQSQQSGGWPGSGPQKENVLWED